MDDDRYPFDSRFQLKVLGLMLNDPVFLPEHADVLDYEYFDEDRHSTLAELITSYHTKYKERPTRAALEAAIRKHVRKGFHEKDWDDREDELLAMANRAFRVGLKDGDYVRDQVVDFGRFQKMRDAIEEAIGILHEEAPGLPEENGARFETVAEVVHRAAAIGSGTRRGANLGDHHRNLGERLAKTIYNPDFRTGTGIAEVDNRNYGGIGRGEVGMVVGPTGRGKSIFLCNFAAAALRQGKNVIYFTFADLHVDDVFARVIQNLAQVTLDQILKSRHDPELAEEIADEAGEVLEHSNLHVHYFNSKEVTVTGLRAYIAQHERIDEWSPDLVIVDYADHIRPPPKSGHTTGDAFSSSQVLGDIYLALKALGKDFGCAVWTASQPKPGTVSKEPSADGSLGSGSYLKSSNADMAFEILQTTQEGTKNPPRARLFAWKSRRGKDFYTVEVELDKDRMTVRSHGLSDQDPDDVGPEIRRGVRGRRRRAAAMAKVRRKQIRKRRPVVQLVDRPLAVRGRPRQPRLPSSRRRPLVTRGGRR